MALQPMSLLDHMLTTPGLSFKYGKSSIHRMPDGGGRFPELRQAKRVWVDPDMATRAMAIAEDGKHPGVASIGPQTLPFDSMYFETRFRGVPTAVFARAERGTNGSVNSYESIHPHKKEIHVGCSSNPMIWMDIDSSGAINSARGDATLGTDSTPADFMHLLPALLAVGLMNCKNVTTERVERINPHQRSSSRKKRKLPPKLDYHTIVLPGSRSGGGALVEGLDVMPHHQVRGHFKTFTAERPLMGQHVGTYWWGWQVRGNKKNGITVTDYKIGATS